MDFLISNVTPVTTLTINDFFMTLNPYTFAGLAIGLSLGVSTSGAAWGIALVGSALTGSAVYKPHVRTRNIVSIVFCEAVAIFGVIAALMGIIVLTAIPNDHIMTAADHFKGWNVFWAGITVGFVNMICGVAVGITGNAAVTADAANPDIFIKVLVVEVFASVLGIFGLILGILGFTAAKKADSPT